MATLAKSIGWTAPAGGPAINREQCEKILTAPGQRFEMETLDIRGIPTRVWKNAPEWQPTREVVEQLTAVSDWCELLFATNIVFEQLVGSLFRTELVMQISARNGDYITPTIVGTGEHDYDRDLNYTRTLFQLLTHDPEYGEANRALFDEWMAVWVPRCLAAARALQPIWSQPADKAVTFATSLEAASAKFTVLLESLGLDIPKELTR